MVLHNAHEIKNLLEILVNIEYSPETHSFLNDLNEMLKIFLPAILVKYLSNDDDSSSRYPKPSHLHPHLPAVHMH